MYVYVNQMVGYTETCNCDEFGQFSNLYNDTHFHNFQVQNGYLITIEAHLRDRYFDETYKSFLKWLCRLSKRCMIKNILVSIEDSYTKTIIQDSQPFFDMFETPSWINKNKEPNWCEYLMWQKTDNSDYPAILAYKYFEDTKNNKRVQNWLNIKQE